MVNICYFTNPLKTGDITHMRKQCVPGLSSREGPGTEENPGNEKVGNCWGFDSYMYRVAMQSEVFKFLTIGALLSQTPNRHIILNNCPKGR